MTTESQPYDPDPDPRQPSTGTLVRRSIWDLESQQPWHPITLAYAQAVGELQLRHPDDPTSWSYQAAIHGSGLTPAQQGWNQCQHGGWYFLPWHRLYLYFFERILRSVVTAQGGPEDWALPYWDYDAGGNSNTLPAPFRAETLPDGAANPLFVLPRNPAVNAGAGLPPQATSAAVAMATSAFAPPPLPGFGGGQTDGPQHFFNATGALEQTPHNVVHVLIGGIMSNPNTAALDPIFWLHHCNVDRLWMEWNVDGNANPAPAAWTDETFELFDEGGAAQTRPVGDAEDPLGTLGYTYDTVAAAVPEVPTAAAANPESGLPEPEMVGAADAPVSLTGGSEVVDVPVDARAEHDALESVARGAGSGRLYLSLEHVDADTTPQQAYTVSVQSTGDDPRRFPVGTLALFGIEQLHEERGDEGPHHHRFVYDISEVAAELGDPSGLEALQVVFEEISLEPGEAESLEAVAAEREVVPIRVGRVTLRRG